MKHYAEKNFKIKNDALFKHRSDCQKSQIFYLLEQNPALNTLHKAHSSACQTLAAIWKILLKPVYLHTQWRFLTKHRSILLSYLHYYIHKYTQYHLFRSTGRKLDAMHIFINNDRQN